ncbi:MULTISPECIES: MATE family efflux transporter [Halococcus]|uniref:Multidrug-efflux transporter n=1 Tax=Halococcus salifodinae DSM 8989 TaxID=1227456 RepID=M0MTI9_9EURY|nr:MULTISPECIES: MATE family efflux transporter [Halococcus]EMA49022.1 efflux protein, mate family [Halococcus salifodinae DSM 8989]
MLGALRDRLYAAVLHFPALLARLGLVDREKGTEAFDLAVPVMVSGGFRTLLRVTDFFMVSLALGSAAVAGLELGFQYYFIGFGLALGLSSGTISVVSRFVGAGEDARANLAIKQSLWLALSVTIPLTLVTWFEAEAMVGLLTDAPQTIALGGTYLRIVMLSVSFRFWSMIAARALQGAGDTRTPMYVRLLTIPVNIVLNAVLIFGVSVFPALGVAGAAWGTTIANVLAGVIFFVLLTSGRYSVRLRLGGTQWSTDIAREVIRVGYPLAGLQLIRTFGRFPFLFVLASLGTGVVAAYAIARRVMLLAMMPAWGYSTASSTLVGQHVGAGDAEEANDYAWQTLRIALPTQLLIAGVLVLFARPIALLFATDTPGLTVEFIRVFGLGVIAFSVSRTMRGGLRGAGDTRWPLYGTLLGTLVRLPIAALALPTTLTITVVGVSFAPGLGLGLVAVYVAMLADLYLRAGVNLFRFWTGKWKTIAARSGVGAGSD